MANPTCPECGPQGGHGRVMLAFSSVDCSLCDGTALKPASAGGGGGGGGPVLYVSRPVFDAERHEAFKPRAAALARGIQAHEAFEREQLLDVLEEHAEQCAGADGTLQYIDADESIQQGPPASYRAHLRSRLSTKRLRELAARIS